VKRPWAKLSFAFGNFKISQLKHQLKPLNHGLQNKLQLGQQRSDFNFFHIFQNPHAKSCSITLGKKWFDV
jgi:hypothetical protein